MALGNISGKTALPIILVLVGLAFALTRFMPAANLSDLDPEVKHVEQATTAPGFIADSANLFLARHQPSPVHLHRVGSKHAIALYNHCAIVFEASTGELTSHLGRSKSVFVGSSESLVFFRSKGSFLAFDIASGHNVCKVDREDIFHLLPQHEMIVTLQEGALAFADIYRSERPVSVDIKVEEIVGFLETPYAIFITGRNTISRVDPDNGRVLWEIPSKSGYGTSFAVSESTIAVGSDTLLSIFDIDSGRLRWKRVFGDAIVDINISHGFIACKVRAPRFALLGEIDGVFVLERKTAGKGRVLYADENVVILTHLDWDTDYRFVEALHPDTGITLWSIREKWASPPVVSSSVPAVYFPVGNRDPYRNDHFNVRGHGRTEGNRILIVDIKSGRVRDQLHVPSSIKSILFAGESLFAGTVDGDLHAAPADMRQTTPQISGGTATIKITTDPQKAAVLMCGKPVGFSPVYVDRLIPGTYNIAANAGGLIPENLNVTVRDRENFHIDLDPLPQIRDKTQIQTVAEVKAAVFRAGDALVRRSQGYLRVFDETGKSEFWSTDRILGPVHTHDNGLIYSVAWETGNTKLRYLVLHPMGADSLASRRPLHLWRGDRVDQLLIDGATLYVADDTTLYAYDLALGRQMWSASSANKIDAIYGIESGAVMTVERGDVVCRDVRNGAETYRFQNFAGELDTGAQVGLPQAIIRTRNAPQL